MDEIDENISQQSSYMDLSVSPDNIIVNNKVLDRPPRNFGKINDLRSIQELPERYRCLFDFPLFNIIQSNVIDDVLYSDVPVVISAPTGSGKTIVFELAIVRLLMKFEETNFTGDFKIIYVAPVKSLCHERLFDWHTKFSKIGLSCIVCTGDSELTDLKRLKNYNIIITTPEKWNSLTRNAKENDFLDSVNIFMIDEVHLLNDELRGPNLEVVVSRMKILRKNQNIRFLAVSATIPNIEDIAEWLGGDRDPAIYFKIGEELRPVKLNKIVIGYPCASETANFKFDVNLNYKLQNVLMQYAEGKPTLIFCSTRKGVELTASHLSSTLTFHLSPEQNSTLHSSSQKMYSTLHKSLVSRGIGVHHAGMSPENRLTIEGLFRDGQLPVLVATSTLAMGVNLPAHLVVVKGTKQFVGGNFQEYGEGSLLQMIGRAGRPRFDTEATVVIMTMAKEKQRYEKMLGGTELIESNLHQHLTEHLNAEVALGTITDIAIALEWLRYTFLYIRVLKNPKHYNIPTNYTKNQIEKKLQDWCQIEINVLNKHGMLQIDQIDGFSLSPTNLGKIMANYYLTFNTMKIFVEIKGTETLSEMLMIISKCTEFSETYLRVNDKKTLNTLNKCKYDKTIRFSLKDKIKTTPMKIFCIIQAVFDCIQIKNPALHQESIKIMRIGERISKCLVQYLLHKNKVFSALLSTLTLNKCFIAKLWENSPYVSRQFPKIGLVLSSMLVYAGKTSFKAILESTPRDIERIINRSPPMGNEIIETVMHLPFYKIHLDSSDLSKFQVKITVTLLNSEDIHKSCTAGLNSYMTLLIGDTENNILVCKKLFHHSMATCKEYVQYVDVVLKTDHVMQVHLISENWVGIDCNENYDIIINQGTISTTSAVNFVNNEKNQTEITSYFKATKNTAPTKKPATKKANNRTIDSYFKPADSNSKLKLMEPPKTNTNCYLNTNENSETNIVSNSNTENNDANMYSSMQYIEDNNCISKVVSTDFDQPLNESSKTVTFDNTLKDIFEENEEVNNEPVDSGYGSQNTRLLLSTNNPRRYMTQQEDFEEFSQNLARKFSQLSDNIKPSSYPKNPVELNTKLAKRLETNRNVKTILNKFKFNPPNKFSHDKAATIKKVPKNNENSKPGELSQNYCSQISKPGGLSLNYCSQISKPGGLSLNYCSQISKPGGLSQNYCSQISLNTFSNGETPQISQQNKSMTNEELQKFKQYMSNKSINFDSNKGISCTVTSQSQICNSKNENIDDEVYPMQFCDVTYNETVSNAQNINDSLENESIISLSSSKNSQTSPIKDIASPVQEEKVNQPYFPKSYREYVQNSIDKLKKSTLVNEYFNYDLGFQEFLMGPLDQSSSSSSCKSDEETNKENQPQNVDHNLEEVEFTTPKNSGDDILLSPQFSPVKNAANITFSSSGEIINKPEFNLNNSLDSFSHSFCGDPSNSPENSFQNLGFSKQINSSLFKDSDLSFSSTIFASKNNVETVFQNSDDSSEEILEKSNLKIENRLKLIEKYYNSPICTVKRDKDNITLINKSPEFLPLKRKKLSGPSQQVLFPISRNKKYFEDRIKNNDSLKNMGSLKQIMSTYGNNENKISLSRNNERKLVEEPSKEEVKQTEYNYSITIYEKQEKQIYNSYEVEGRKSRKEKRKESSFMSFSHY